MTLLFDENVSPKLVDHLTHGCRITRAEDHQVWEYARAHAFAIVSKDTDFRERSLVEGFLPKIIWLDVGNAGTAAIAELLRSERERVERFETLEETSLLILSIGLSAV